MRIRKLLLRGGFKLKVKKSLALLILVSILSTSTLLGCKAKVTPTTEAKQELDKDQSLNVAYTGDPRTLDPSLEDESIGMTILRNSSEALTRIEVDEKGNEINVPAGAKEWKLSDDELTWTFKLRDFQWSDGKKVTAGEYVYSILRTLDPKTASTYSQFLLPIKGAGAYNSGKGKAEDVGVKAVDDNTLEIKLERKTPYFLQLTSFSLFLPQRKEFVEKYGNKYGTEAETLLATGPFVIKEWVHDSKIVLEKNPKYWDADKVKLNTVTFKIIKEESARMNEFQNGGVDIADVTTKEWIDKFKKDNKYTQLDKYIQRTAYFLWNQTADIKIGDKTVKLFSNAKVRKAFSLAIDREQVAEILMGGSAAPATAWIPFTNQLGDKEFRALANSEPLTKLKQENKDPKALLIEGLKELGVDPDPSKVTVKYAVGNTTAQGKKDAELYQSMFEKTLGIKVTIEQMESAKRMAKINKTLDYEISNLGWGADYNDPSTFLDMWLTSLPNYKTGYANKKYDDLVLQADNIIDNTKRLSLYKQAEELLIYEDAVIAPTVFYKNTTFNLNYVKKFDAPRLSFKYTYIQGKSK